MFHINCNTTVFSSEALGKGIAVIPEEDIIYAPISGEIVTLFPTHHAIGIKADNGVEVLIHIGIDTVELEGKYFESFIKQGECVQVGQKLISFDRQKIKEKGYDDTVVMIVTNSDNYLDIIPSQEKNVTYDETCLTVVLA